MFAVEKIVLQSGAAVDKALDLFPVQVMAVFCAALSVVAFILQIFYILHSSKNIKNYRRIKRFVVKRGDIDLSNSHKFYKKCVKHMPRSVKKAWKRQALIGSEYAGSELQAKMNRVLTKEKRPMMFYYYLAFSCVAALQTLLMCKGLEWTMAVCYTALAAAVWAAVGLVAKLYSYIQYKRNRIAAAGILRILENRLTLKDKDRAKVYFVSSQDFADVKRAADVPRNEVVEKLVKTVNSFVQEKPDKEVAKIVENGIAQSVCAGSVEVKDKEPLKEAVDALKKYTA